MLSKDVAIVNGMVRTKDSVKVRDLDTNNPVGHYKGFLVFKQKDEKYVGVDSNDFEVKGNNLDDLKRKIDRYIPIQNKDSKTKDDWSPEARKKALEARRAHKKAQPVEPTKQRQPAKQEIEMSKHASPTPAKEETVNPANIKPNSDLKRWFNVNTIKKKNIKMVEPAVDDNGDFIPGKTEFTTATLYRGILKSGENKGRSYTYLKSYDMGEEKGGLIGDDKWDQIRETMHRDDVEKLGLKSFGR